MESPTQEQHKYEICHTVVSQLILVNYIIVTHIIYFIDTLVVNRTFENTRCPDKCIKTQTAQHILHFHITEIRFVIVSSTALPSWEVLFKVKHRKTLATQGYLFNYLYYMEWAIKCSQRITVTPIVYLLKHLKTIMSIMDDTQNFNRTVN